MAVNMRIDRSLLRGLAALLFAVTVVACGSGGGGDPDPEVVRIVYVVESSWFATDPVTLRQSLDQASRHMTTCAESTSRHCEVMMFAVQGAEVSAKRVPESLKQSPETGYWYSLDPEKHVKSDSLWRDLVARRIGTFVANVGDEIVPDTYEQQPKGCVNLVGNLAKAFEELGRHPGDRNVVVVFASGVSNCLGQPFYPDRPFPSAGTAAESILAEVPPGSAVVDSGRAPICFDWSPMFGQGVLEADAYISQEQRQVLKAAWLNVLDQWGAVRGNSPGEQLGDCLTMEMSSS
jgi:hypothetical protein